MKKFIALFLVATMAFSLYACGNSASTDTKKSGTDVKTSGSAGTDGKNETATSAPTAASTKDSAIIATSDEPYRFFAQSKQSCSGADNLVLSNVYDCLLRLEADGTLTPALAESYTVSEDGLVYTFNLRKGVKFHNGKEMTAEDVKFTFDYGFEGPIGTALFVNYQKCDIVDDHTVNVTLSSPYAAFLYGVASRLGGVACKSYFDEVGDDVYLKKPIGTGPYKFVEWVSGDHTSLVANEDYWGNVPAIKNITIQVVADTNTQILGLQNGDYDIVRNPAIDVCTRLEGDTNVAWNSTLSTGRITLCLNDWTGPCKDINFRKAVQAGIDKQMINDGVYAGRSEVLDIDMCSNYGGFVTKDDGIKAVSYDLEAAKSYLAKSGYNGEKFTISVPSGTPLESAAKIIQAQFMEVGINCEIKATDYQTYSSEWKDRTYESYLINNLCSLVDADGVYTAHRLDREAWEDRVFTRDGEISELLLKGRAAQGEARKPLYVEACNIITDEAYDVPIVNDLSTIAFRANMNGVKAHCLGNMYFADWSFK